MAQEIDSGEYTTDTVIDTGEYTGSDDHAKPVAGPFDRSGISDFSSLLNQAKQAGDAILPLFTRRSSNFGKTASNAAPVSNGLASQLALLGYSAADIKGLTKGQKERIIAGGIQRGQIASRVNAAAANPPAIQSGGNAFGLSPTLLVLGAIAVIWFVH